MRLGMSLAAVLLLACGGGGAPATAPTSSVTPTATATAKPATAVAEDPSLPAIGNNYLVIVASKLVAKEAEAVAEAALPAVKGVAGTQPRTLPSVRFKNLMPCYTVAIAGAFPKKEDAAALSKTLKAAGVDNYIKNAGALVPVSAALNAYCSARQNPVASSDVKIVISGAGASWLPVAGEVPAEVSGLVALDKKYDTWEKSLGAGSGAAWHVVSTVGQAQECTTPTRSLVTRGTPHFGVLEGPPPTVPACGSPQMTERLSCQVADGYGVAVPAGRPAPVVWKDTEERGLEKAAEALVAKVWGGAGTRSVEVRRYSANGQSVLLVKGTVDDSAEMGVCGGTERSWFAAFLPEGQGFGRQMGPWQSADFVDGVWLIDVDADGIPEMLHREFPEHATLIRMDGSVIAEQNIDYCDCPC